MTIRRILTSRDAARTKIQERIDEAKKLAHLSIGSAEQLDEAERRAMSWREVTDSRLRSISPALADKFSHVGEAAAVSSSMYDTPAKQRAEFFKDLDEDTRALESFLDQLEDFEQPPQPKGVLSNSKEAVMANSVFVVHGHDAGFKESVARCITTLGLEPIILHEQANQGRTIIEKFEAHAAEASFAVVLLTPDDVGGRAGEATSPRARQNVILELGYFLGKLGRKHVCAMHVGAVELPSDILGILYTPIDDAGAWRFQLAKELRAAGLQADSSML